ncbi:MAG: hypothetical protein IIT88_01090 [Acetobacter sp.]|nr:hypothetical protein [Acetobacter sp.]MBQ5515668.1 hypothetical protein [Acetobacter sp.]
MKKTTKKTLATLLLLSAFTTTAKAQIPFPNLPQCGPDPLHGPNFACFDFPSQQSYINSMKGVDRPFDRGNPYNINTPRNLAPPPPSDTTMPPGASARPSGPGYAYTATMTDGPQSPNANYKNRLTSPPNATQNPYQQYGRQYSPDNVNNAYINDPYGAGLPHLQPSTGDGVPRSP